MEGVGVGDWGWGSGKSDSLTFVWGGRTFAMLTPTVQGRLGLAVVGYSRHVSLWA